MGQFNLCDMMTKNVINTWQYLRREDYFQSFDILSIISQVTSLLLYLKFYILCSRSVTKGEEVSSALFQKLESPGDKTEIFSCWVRIKSIFQRKKHLSCKLLARNQLHYKLMIQHLTHRCIFEFHQSKKNLDISISHLTMARSLKNSRNLKLSSFFQGSSLLEKLLCFLPMKQISMELAW